MSLTRIRDTAVEIIRNLPNRPTGFGGRMSAAALKMAFDQAAENIKNAVNQMIGELEGTGGAAEIGFQRSTGVPADNVQDAIENVQQQLQDSVQDPRVLPNGSVTTEKLDSDAMGWEDVTETIDPQTSDPFTGADSYCGLTFMYSPVLKMMAVNGDVAFTIGEQENVTIDTSLQGYRTYRQQGSDAALAAWVNNGIPAAVLQDGQRLRVRIKNISAVQGDLIVAHVSGFYFCEKEGS